MSTIASTSDSFTWLHITDLHSRMSDQDWLWPTLKASFFQDLSVVQESTGPIDTVIFSGDLTQTGKKDDFDRLDQILSELWGALAKQGSKPSLLVIPGNHDVQWPDKLNPPHHVLKQWWNIQNIHNGFFSEADNPYRAAVRELLSEYTAWQERLAKSTIPTVIPARTGVLQGDQSFTLQKGSLRIGLILLNSTWLQIDDDDYHGKLHVDTRQLQLLTNDSPVQWCDNHHLNLLVTHHPIDWLHPDSQQFWDSDINPSKRFDAHLFGHMHSGASQAVSAGGGEPRRSIQGASLFGLRKVQNKFDRIHGYSIGRALKSADRIEVRVWPRIVTQRQDGSRALGRDQRFELRESDGSYRLLDKHLPGRNVPDDSNDEARSPKPSTALQVPTNDPDDVLKRVRYHLPLHVAHFNVRKVEQQNCIDALSIHHAVWLVSDWGMAEDGFLSSVRYTRAHTAAPSFRIDLSDFKSRDQMFDSLKAKLGCSIDRFSEILSNAGDTYVIFDDFPTTGVQEGQSSLEVEFEEIVKIILEFCPQLNVVIIARRTPAHHSLPVVEIGPLDPADLKNYILDHEKGGPDRATAATVSALHNHTDGIPTRVDQALRHLEVVTLSELIGSNTDLTITTPVGGRYHPGLVRSLRELSESSDPNERRIFSLLKALMTFPQGEQLSRIKRFNLNAPFHPQHAEELLDRSLVDVTTLQRIENRDPDTQARTLVVPRQTRDCLREMMDADEFRELNQKAAELYFGDSWRAGVIKPRPSYRFDRADCATGVIQNASTIIVRLFNDAREQGNERDAERSLGLANWFLEMLTEGVHYSGAVNFCEQIIPMVSEETYGDHKAKLMKAYGGSLRMLGEVRKARDILCQITEHQFSLSSKQGLHLDLALCYKSLNENDDAREQAQLAISLDKHSHAALHAQAILIEFDDDAARRDRRLMAHETKCRKQKAFVVANNIALRRARESSDPTEAKRILAPIMQISKDNHDHYNQTRAVIELAQLAQNVDARLGEKEMIQLINAYYFLFNERFAGLFDQCHAALWKGLSARADLLNLKSLFRYSSLYWRLRGREDFEKRYMQALIREFGSAALADASGQKSRETLYIQVRARAAGLLPASAPFSIPHLGTEPS